jgi:peptide/nickel transport system substrate-binding protein
MIATEIPTEDNGGITDGGKVFTFKIRDGVKFHDGSDMTINDVAFTFVRNILAGGTASPQWMLTEPIFGAGISDIAEVVDAAANGADLADPASILGAISDATPYDDRATLATYDPATLQAVCEDLKGRIVADEAAGTVTFNLAQPWAPFLATLAGGGWGGIQSQAWVAANGGWDGDCANWTPFYGWSSEEFNQTELGRSVMGTGPYKFDHWTAGEEIVLTANEDYWMSEPAWDGAPVGAPALKTVIIKQVDEFSTRLAMAQAGDADNVLVGSTEDWPIVDEMVAEEGTYAQWLAGEAFTPVDEAQPFIKITDIQVASNRTDIGFQFNINTEGGNSFVGSGKLDGDGVPATFFADEHVRKAFNYCFDYDTYLADVLQGEGTRAPVLMLPGMSGYDETAPQYTYDIAKCQEELAASTWTTCSESEDAACVPQSLSEVGFRLSAVYNTGNTQRQTIAELLQAGLQEAGEQYVVEVVGLPWPTFLQANNAKKLPIFIIGWQSDYYDTHNWTYTFTAGYYAFKQSYPADLKAEFTKICTDGVTEVDPVKRDQIYKDEFNTKYYETAPAILLFNVKQRSYQPKWVNGWYANPMYSNKWYYVLSKD